MSEILDSLKKQRKNVIWVGIIVSIVMFGILLIGYNNFSDVKTIYIRMGTVEEGSANINVTRIEVYTNRSSESELNIVTQSSGYFTTFNFSTDEGDSNFLEWNIIGLFLDLKILLPKIYTEISIRVFDNTGECFTETLNNPYRISTILLETVNISDNTLNATVIEINPFLEFLKYV